MLSMVVGRSRVPNGRVELAIMDDVARVYRKPPYMLVPVGVDDAAEATPPPPPSVDDEDGVVMKLQSRRPILPGPNSIGDCIACTTAYSWLPAAGVNAANMAVAFAQAASTSRCPCHHWRRQRA